MSNNPAELQDQKENDPVDSSSLTPSTTLPGSESPNSESSVSETPNSETTSPSPESAAATTQVGGPPATGASVNAEPGNNSETEGHAPSSEATETSDAPKANEKESESDSKLKVKIGSQRESNSGEVLIPKAVKDAQETPMPIVDSGEAPEPVAIGPSVDELGNQWEKEAEAGLDEASLNAMMDTASADADLDLPVSSRVKGTVTKVHGDTVFFLLKGQYDGILPLKQFKKEPEPGTMTDVVVTGFNNDESLYELSLPGAAVAVADWSDLNVGNLVEVRITGSNTGGLECSINNIRGFIPASQIDISRVENMGSFVNQTLECVITEANKKKKNLVLSRRAILEKELQERKKEILETFEVGSTVEGTVSKLRDFGAFVNIGSGVEGLIHISKCSWHHIKHPSEVFTEGQQISVRIEKINKEKGKIQLSHRDTIEHPWKRVAEKYPLETTVNGTVSKVADFGAFIKLETGIEGLVHISEIAHERVKSVASVLSEGQEVEVKILSLDADKQKMSLSIKALLPVPVKEEKPKAAKEPDQPAREMAVKRRNKPLKGGTTRDSSGDKFGLKW